MKLPTPCLMLVTDRRLCGGRSLVNLVAAAVAGGVNAVQLREKDLPAGDLWELARKLRTVTKKRALLIVNDRVDVALACGADGVHLPEAGLPVAAARRVAGLGFLIGRSVHSVEGARSAAAEAAEGESPWRGADYLVAGTIFPSRSHPGVTPVGPALLAEIRLATGLPILAIGGIERDNVAQVMAAGAQGCAVISAILGARDPRRAAQELAEALREAMRSPSGAPAG